MCVTEALVESLSAMQITIPKDDADSCLIACKSRRNLAGRLATRLLTKEERCGSNTRGMCGKKALNVSKVKAIYSLCISNYPLKCCSAAAEDMRNAMDKMYGKTKVIQPENLLPAHPTVS